MKKRIINTLAALAMVAGLLIGAACDGILAFAGAFVLTWGGLVSLIHGNTSWIWSE